MMSYLRYGFAAIVALLFVTIALANRSIVTVKLLPDTLASLTGIDMSVSLPLFVLLGIAIAIGLLLGFVWEWFREHGYRAEAARLRREHESMRAELKRVETATPQARKDDVLALVEAK